MFIALPDFLFVTSASKEGKIQQSYYRVLHANRHEIRAKTLDNKEGLCVPQSL